MAPPPIQLFLTTIVSQTTLRQRQEFLLRVLQVKKVAFTSYDLASDEKAKNLWRRKAPRDKQQLPGILVGGEFAGTFQEFEEAVEFGELDQFLRLKEEWKPFEDDAPLLSAQPVGVPGAYSPDQMHPHHRATPSPQPSPLKTKPIPENKRTEKAYDAGQELEDPKLQGVNVTEDDLLALVEELGLGGDEANEFVKGLTGDAPAKDDKEPSAPSTVAVGNKGDSSKQKTDEPKREVTATEKVEEVAEATKETV